MRGELLPDGVRGWRGIVVQARQRRLQRAVARGAALLADRIVVVQIEGAQQRLEREPLDDQRAEHDAERGEHDEVADTESAAGSASAAASETMPRMPAHEMTRPLPTVGRSIGRGGLNPNRRSRQRMTALNDMCQARRTTITVTRTAPATAR